MRGTIVLLLCLGIVAFWGTALAQEAPTYLAVHLPEGVTITVDGDPGDWDWFPNDAKITQDMLFVHGGPDEVVDLADCDITMMVAWSDETNMIYGMVDVFDDFINRDSEAGYHEIYLDDDVEIFTDPDNSGGVYHAGGLSAEDDSKQGQQWIWSAPGPDNNFFIYDSREVERFAIRPPYAFFVVGPEERLPVAHGDRDVQLYYEFAMALWDYLDPDPEDPTKSIPHDLMEGEIIGLSLLYDDNDDHGDATDGVWKTHTGANAYYDADEISDFELVPYIPTAVTSSTWAQIKATFVR